MFKYIWLMQIKLRNEGRVFGLINVTIKLNTNYSYLISLLYRCFGHETSGHNKWVTV
jgi:hypothetical protein